MVLSRVETPSFREEDLAGMEVAVWVADDELTVEYGGEILGEEGWVKVLKLAGYSPRRPPYPGGLQQVLFAEPEAI